MIILIIWIILGHYILDYPLQGDFLASTKGKYFYSLLAHSLIYAAGMSSIFYYLVSHNNILIIFSILLITHYVIDYIKSHAKNKDKALTLYLYIDQALHLIINFILLSIFLAR
jgi:hypothetical protein